MPECTHNTANYETVQGRIVAISTSTRRGIPKSNQNEVLLIENWGMEDDVHAGRTRHRQISLLAMEGPEDARQRCAGSPGAFAENLTTEFIDIPNLSIGTRVVIGDSEPEIYADWRRIAIRSVRSFIVPVTV